MPPFVFFDSAMLALAAAAVWTIIGDDFNFMYPGGLLLKNQNTNRFSKV